ncbi:MAG: dienelactone hydrolase family protein, partial [Planctomycetaceae bacterium]|nr:dienelactone hydrolase family protein [Planctomycetaceae bacterium]
MTHRLALLPPCLLILTLTPLYADPEQDRLEREFQQIQRSQIETYLDLRLRESYAERKSNWSRDFSSIENYERSIAPRRQAFIEYLGGFPYKPAPLVPREQIISRSPTHTSWRVRIPAFDGVEVYGILLVPDVSLYPGKRPSLLCLHGMLSTPERVCGIVDGEDYHRRFGLQAVQRGYVVFAPLMINTPQRREWLDRKGIMIAQRLQALEQFKMLRAVDYLSQREDVAADRIGAYGISWGGRTAMYAAAIDPRIACCVISGHFMESTRKMVLPHEPESYSTYIEAGHA